MLRILAILPIFAIRAIALLAHIGSSFMKAHGLHHASHSCNPTYIRNSRYRAACSYRLASLMARRIRVRALDTSGHGDRAFIVKY